MQYYTLLSPYIDCHPCLPCIFARENNTYCYAKKYIQSVRILAFCPFHVALLQNQFFNYEKKSFVYQMSEYFDDVHH